MELKDTLLMPQTEFSMRGNLPENEQIQREKWNEMDLYNKIKEKNKGNKPFVLHDGPPYANGNIHLGHAFQKILKDFINRSKMMEGYFVDFIPGWDTHGLPIEHAVTKTGVNRKELGVAEFRKLCEEYALEQVAKQKDDFIRLNVIADWENPYITLQKEFEAKQIEVFAKMAKKGLIKSGLKPVYWSPSSETALAEAEIEYKNRKDPSIYVAFDITEGNDFVKEGDKLIIWTTTPWTLPGNTGVCVGEKLDYSRVKVGDEYYIIASELTKPLMEEIEVENFRKLKTFKGKDLVGVIYKHPFMDRTSPVVIGHHVTLESGTGLVHTAPSYGEDDFIVGKNNDLPMVNGVDDKGVLTEESGMFKGLFFEDANKEITKWLDENGHLVKLKFIKHSYPHDWRTKGPVIFRATKQWFCSVEQIREDLLNEIDEKINFHTPWGKTRIYNMIRDRGDWCISRQRYFGVPFPVWYCASCGEPIFARQEDLPVNPLVDKPKINSCKCGCTEFVPETDVMDTWATSSVTPLINMRYGEKENFESFLKPMSIRTNASEIIRTWDFYTIVKSFYHFGMRPWDNVMISGFVMANKGEKISKSKGNSKVEPIDLIAQYSADVIRYWAGSGRLGTDIVFSEETLLRGRKLVNKLWNVAKFIEMHLSDYEDKEFNTYEYIDKWILGKYQDMESGFIKYLDEYEVGLALNTLEKFFWNFCDNYIEIVKHRLYRPEEFGEVPRYSGQKTIYTLLYKLLQDFSIFFPFITEEIYQELYHDNKSIHLTQIEPLNFDFKDEIKNGDIMIDIISHARGEKTNNNVSLKTPIKVFDLSVNEELENAINDAIKDFKATLTIQNLKLSQSGEDYKINNIELEIENQD